VPVAQLYCAPALVRVMQQTCAGIAHVVLPHEIDVVLPPGPASAGFTPPFDPPPLPPPAPPSPLLSVIVLLDAPPHATSETAPTQTNQASLTMGFPNIMHLPRIDQCPQRERSRHGGTVHRKYGGESLTSWATRSLADASF